MSYFKCESFSQLVVVEFFRQLWLINSKKMLGIQFYLVRGLFLKHNGLHPE